MQINLTQSCVIQSCVMCKMLIYELIIYMQIILISSPIRKHFERQSNNVQKSINRK